MKSLLLLFPLFILVLPTTSLFILLPLYIYPGTSASAWNSVFNAITKYSNVHWQVVVNPDSGPGALTSAGYPSADYISGIAKLNTFANVQTLGYVHTSYAAESYSTLTHNISVYANWASDTQSNITIDGIFFDEVSNSNASDVLTYMDNASAYAYATVPTDITPVVFNVGVRAPWQFFDWADTIIQVENAYSTYQNYTTISSFSPSNRTQTAIVLHNTPSKAPVQSLVHTMIYYGIEATYFTLDCCYNAVDSTFLSTLAAAVQAG